ncbi:hypothetical protein QN362_04900 [Actimicrobium sp. CCC2.4]|uniref:hypothetical protein n=1 Tax=Actimicrobium sp. CCC2.4 TaxID=3048606 RepID=UPI002AC8DB5C|nr:hypothetical protein [Actimicrobium sp. CCC2.4]MEB0134664.1 hypothetical protein [Actimicrobium sp. CCC2.4]WPX30607.1 hypothetical protein RHM62_09985 [Actimicrobium sp. CCC2.4]
MKLKPTLPPLQVRPDTAPSTPAGTTSTDAAVRVRRLSTGTLNRLQDKLRPVTEDAIAIRQLLDARAELIGRQAGCGSADELLKAFGDIAFLKKFCFNTAPLALAFSESRQAFLLRTLTRKSARHPDDPQFPDSGTPGKTERNTLNNQLPERNIQLTPATAIYPDVGIATISSHPDRPRWHGMPSVMYATPLEQDVGTIGKVDNYRKMFGNTLSFASNDGFTKEFVRKVKSRRFSHAELIDAFKAQPPIKKNLKTPLPFNQLHESLSALRQQIRGYRAHRQSALYPDGSVPHNEVIARLWLWDATAVEVGKEVGEGLCAAIELQVARSALAIGLQKQGSDHRLVKDFLMQQLSVGDNNAALKKSAAKEKFNRLTGADKQLVCDTLIAKLLAPVTLCHYTPGTAGMSPVSLDTLPVSAVVAAMDKVLGARLGPNALALHTQAGQTDP